MSSFFNNKLHRMLMLDRFKWWYFTLLTCFAGGIVFGIFFSTSGVFEIGTWFSEDYFLMIFQKKSITDILISRALNNFGIIVLMSICVVTPFMIPMNYLVMIYRGYILGVIMATLITLYSVVGVMLIVFVFIPCQFCYSFTFIMATVNGVNCCTSSVRPPLSKAVFYAVFVYIMSMVVALFEVILVIVVVRPMNFVM